MKEWFERFTAELAALILALAIFSGVIYWRIMVWWNSPLGEEMILLPQKTTALQPDYIKFWGILFGIIALAFLGVLIWIGSILSKK